MFRLYLPHDRTTKASSSLGLLRFFLILTSLLSWAGSSFAGNLNTLLSELDNAIKNEKEYISQKEAYLDKLKKQLSEPELSLETQCFICLNLAHEYETYKCDSAVSYSRRSIAIANELGNEHWVNDGKIQWARNEAKAGMFSEAIDILNSIRHNTLTKSQLSEYYKTHIECYIYQIEYQDGHNLDPLLRNRTLYQDSLLRIVDHSTFDYVIYSGHRYIAHTQLDSAEKILTQFLPNVSDSSKEMASLASLLSHIYGEKGEYEKQKEYLAISAIADVKSCIKENISLRALAVLLFQESDLQRANRYVKKSLDDANFYNARLRNIQTSQVLPIIDKAYELDRIDQQHKLRMMLVMISVLSIILLVTILLVAMQMKRLSRANKFIENANSRLKNLNTILQNANRRQQETNAYLAEANHIKELFIGNFLDICTEYIEKLRAFKVTVNRKIRAGQSADLLRLTSNTEGSPQELRELYTNFDRAFLNIYPTFVEEFNKLLREDERYPEHEDGSLNHELRVFALIRLGIKDTNKIATFLNYTSRTVYNYRSKVKSKALNSNEDFEERVKQIGSENF